MATTNKNQNSDAWEYSSALDTTKVTIESKSKLFIGGKFVSPKSRSWFATINPATETKLSDVACAGKADVEAAVKAAKTALPKWSRLSGTERAKYLYRVARRIQERAREFAILETMDGGKPIKESRDVDIPLAAQHFFYYAGWADKLAYAFPGSTPAPVGVCAQIIPWNFPLLMAAWKLAPALACGNTCILKPAETTSLTALRLAEVFQEVGLPDGVVNIITGEGDTGRLLAQHNTVNKVAFTGSTEVGKLLMRGTAGTGKKLTLELGGKSANILFADAAMDQAVEGIVAGIYFNQGHVCCAGSRLFVEEPILEEVIYKLKQRLGSLRVGDPLDKNTDLGAINSKSQLKVVEGYIRSGVKEGAQLHQLTTKRLPSKGFWCNPCFFTDVQPSHTIAREEIFGPVLSVMTFRTPEEAISRANNSPYGLAAGVWTDKGAKIFEVAKKLDAGIVWCNTYNKFDASSPFGGFKESGFGREGGMQGLRAYVRLGGV
ncbi:MAG TPA: aldehyde dehydrogenase family protein [Phycisphaerales bacterium]|nr:aldehyde dehydrogenase family protein [Phycisphaerales bacterium]HIN83298.1 aldehyde dehydrogenase family protein [Phycisphaerales bacterium]HIO19535.1 aldehyde dehydrogenase family protein [Phycisphaerales bacterium]HIO53488.1 aldehyde dehydrogenase family protein [Phycisphaerales bacterium]